MEKFIKAIVFILIVPIWIIGCTGNDNAANVAQQIIEDSICEGQSEPIKGRIIEDSVIGHWTIKALKDSNNVTVGRHDWSVRDSSVYLSLSYDNRTIFTDTEIRTKDLVGKEGEYIMQWGGDVFWLLILRFTCHLVAFFLIPMMVGICCIKFCLMVNPMSL